MGRRLDPRSGITFLEVVIAVACCALLAAILVPLGGNMIDKARIAKAQQDCQTIAAAMENFVQDVNRWPTMGSTGSYGVACTLQSGPTKQDTEPYGFRASDTKTRKWVRAGNGLDASWMDLINNHLVQNTPYNQSTNTYPTSGQYRWRGPYLSPTGLDPWGHPYLVIIEDYCSGGTRLLLAGQSDGTFARIVVSAGPNGLIDSTYHSTRTSGLTQSVPAGDDIWVRFDVE